MQRQKQIFSLLAILSLLLGLLASAWPLPVYAGGPPAIIYVDATATGANSGLSWEDALTDLQAAITMALSGVEIWVAESTYTPGIDRTSTFQLKNGVEMYGGFPWGGGDGSFEARDPWAHPTTLSGEIGDPSSRADNCYHVVTGSGTDGTTILDGFVVTGGYADGAFPHNIGGGMYNNAGSPLVRNVVFRGNYAGNYGGGMENEGASNPLIVNVKFEGNVAAAFDGGGLDNFNSAPTLINVLFSGNYAQRYGGGLSNYSSSPGIVNTTFVGNQAGNSGGGIYNKNSSNPIVNNTILWGNTPEQMSNLSAAPAINYGLVQDGCPAGATCDANLLAGDPLFMRTPDSGDDSVWGTDDDDYGDLRLQAGSPAIDSGSNLLYPAGYDTDLPGNPRHWDGPGVTGANQPQVITFIDRGAYENPAGRLYVDKTATGSDTGDSWANALTDLQPALKWGRSGPTEIWVAEGLFTPGTGRTDTFQLLNGVALYGSFPRGGGDGTFNARRTDGNYDTTLFGDIGTENVYHVVTARQVDSSAVLDAFYISSGRADGPAPHDTGGGMLLEQSSPTLRHLLLGYNTAGDCGGGIKIDGGGVTLEDVSIFRNSAYDGGGIYVVYADFITIKGGRIYKNTASSTGGMGGGIYNDHTPLTLFNVVFEQNTATTGGGLSTGGGPAVLANVVFNTNRADDDGGGLFNYKAALSLSNSTFSGNWAGDEGGGISSFLAVVEITNSIFWLNQAGTAGNQLSVDQVASLDISSSIIQGGCPAGTGTCTDVLTGDPNFLSDPAPGNDAAWGTWDDEEGDLRLQTNSPAVDAGKNATVSLDVLDLDGDGDTAETLPFDVAFNPRLVDVASAADTGIGTPPIVDMGAYETPPDRLYVDQAAVGAATGISWTDAFTDLQDALTWEQSGAIQVWVAEGTYTPGTERLDTFVVRSHTALYGGFPTGGGAGDFAARDWQAHVTNLSGEIGDPATVIDNNYTILTFVRADSTAILDGFTIRDGYSDGAGVNNWESGGGAYIYGINGADGPALRRLVFRGNYADNNGGGLYLSSVKATLEDVLFTDNTAFRGGGLYLASAKATLEDVLFTGNTASWGGGLYVKNSGAFLKELVFEANTADNGGGGMSNSSLADNPLSGNAPEREEPAGPTLLDVTFRRNDGGGCGLGGGLYNEGILRIINAAFLGNSASMGGGVYQADPGRTLSLTNALFSGNTAEGGGGLSIYDPDTGAKLKNVTFGGNQASSRGGGIFMKGDNLTLQNVILWGNTAEVSGGQVHRESGTVSLDYGLAQGGCPTGATCSHTQDADPLFVQNPDPGADGVWGTSDDEYGNLTLQADSPAIDAGDNDALPADWPDLDDDGDHAETLPYDLDGSPRRVDIENVADTGNGLAPIVDIGAYEAQLSTYQIYLPLVRR